MVPIRFQIMLTSIVMNGAATLQDILGRYELNCSCEDCAIKNTVQEFGCEYRENNIPDSNLRQLFVKDPSDVMYELNFFVSEEPEGAVGPDSSNQYIPGNF